MQAGEVLRRVAFNTLDMIKGGKMNRIMEVNESEIVRGITPEYEERRLRAITDYARYNCAFYKDIPEGRYHLVVDLLVIHNDGTYLLTRRSDEKDVNPGFWEASAGGSALSGEEPLDAAKRELFEETGIVADSLELVGVSFKDSSHGLYYSYLAKVSCEKDSIVLQEGETTDYKWVDRKGLLEYVDSDGAMKSHNQRYEKYINSLR